MKKKIYILSIIFFLIDIISKIIILSFSKSLPIVVVDNFFIIDKVTNTGAAFSFFDGYRIMLILIAIFAIIYIIKYFMKDINNKWSLYATGLLLGGILGNLFDRIVYKEVIDFLSFNIFGYMFPVFNLADTFIVIGIAILIIDFIRGEKNDNRSTRKSRKN